MVRITREVFIAVANHVREEARKKLLSGVFVMADVGVSPGVVYYEYICRVSSRRVGVDGKRDVNFLAVAMSKLAVMVADGVDSGHDTGIFGEVAYKGGHISEDENTMYVFSGATQDEDLELVLLAEEFHRSLT